MNIVACFNNKGGFGTATLLYHIAHMLAEMQERVLVVDLDPQANATNLFVAEGRLTELWPDGEHTQTISAALDAVMREAGDEANIHVEEITDNLSMIVGDLALATYEDELSQAWAECRIGDETAIRAMTAFYRVILMGAKSFEADWVLVDVGPNLGAINKAALIASEHVIVPLGPDLFSLEGLRTLGPALQSWRTVWQEIREKYPDHRIPMPGGNIAPLGYVVFHHGIRETRTPREYQRWINAFPSVYRESVLGIAPSGQQDLTVDNDENCIAKINHYPSLLSMAALAHKPVFALTPADGAIGAHGQAVRMAHAEFVSLVKKIKAKIDNSD